MDKTIKEFEQKEKNLILEPGQQFSPSVDVTDWDKQAILTLFFLDIKPTGICYTTVQRDRCVS